MGRVGERITGNGFLERIEQICSRSPFHPFPGSAVRNPLSCQARC